MASNLFSRYDEDARLTIYFAFMLASHRNKIAIGADDLLLALTWRQHAAECPFRALKNDFAAIWEGVGVPHLPISVETFALKAIPLDRETRRIVRRSEQEANLDDAYWVDIDHILRGILFQRGLPAKVLEETGWNRERIAAVGAAARALYPPKAPPRWWKLYLFFSRLERYRWVGWALLALLAVGVVLYLRSQN